MLKKTQQGVEVVGVSKSYGAVRALRGVDFSVSRGEVRALLGKNGAGKSTLIRILAGAEVPDEGSVRMRGVELGRGQGIRNSVALGVRTVYQELSLIPQMTVAENLFMGEWPNAFGVLRASEMLARCKAVLRDFGIEVDPRAKVAELSIAEQQLVEIARAVISEPELLILDEPTSSLGSGEVDLVLSTVKTVSQRGVGVIYVSHRLAEIRRIADSVTVLRDGVVVANTTADQTSPEELATAMIGKSSGERAFDTGPKRDNTVAIDVRNLTVGGKFRDVSFEVREGEVLGIAGLLGSGRSELLQALAGLRGVSGGQIVIFGVKTENQGRRVTRRLGVGFTSEDRKTDGIIPDRGLDENLVMAAWRKVSRFGIVNSVKLRMASEKLIGELSVNTDSTSAPIRTLSGGNQQKVVIGRQLHADSRVLLLDEPTRGVDIEAKSQIYTLLRGLAREGRAVVFVSSEIEELPLVADRVLVLAGGRLVEELHAPNFDTAQLLVSAMSEPQTPLREDAGTNEG